MTSVVAEDEVAACHCLCEREGHLGTCTIRVTTARTLQVAGIDVEIPRRDGSSAAVDQIGGAQLAPDLPGDVCGEHGRGQVAHHPDQGTLLGVDRAQGPPPVRSGASAGRGHGVLPGACW